jgi:hypothetical protein
MCCLYHQVFWCFGTVAEGTTLTQETYAQGSYSKETARVNHSLTYMDLKSIMSIPSSAILSQVFWTIPFDGLSQDAKSTH